MVDVIEIDDDSDGEVVDVKPTVDSRLGRDRPRTRPDDNNQEVESEPVDKKPKVKNVTPTDPSELLESRRRKIDQLMDVYVKYHHRLISVEYMMSDEQLARWHSHLDTSYASVSSLNYQVRMKAKQRQDTDQNTAQEEPESVPSTSAAAPAVAPSRPPWFIDPPDYRRSAASNARGSAAASGNSLAVPRRRKYKRRKRPTVSRKTTKRKPAANWASDAGSSTSRTKKATRTTTSSGATTTSRSTASKPKTTKLQAMLAKVKVKRER